MGTSRGHYVSLLSGLRQSLGRSVYWNMEHGQSNSVAKQGNHSALAVPQPCMAPGVLRLSSLTMSLGRGKQLKLKSTYCLLRTLCTVALAVHAAPVTYGVRKLPWSTVNKLVKLNDQCSTNVGGDQPGSPVTRTHSR